MFRPTAGNGADEEGTLLRPPSNGSPSEDTPVPTPAGDAASRSKYEPDPDATLLGRPGQQSSSPEEDATRIRPAGTPLDSVDPEATRVMGKPGRGGSEDATMIAGPDSGVGKGTDDDEEESSGPLMVGLPFGQRYVILKMLGIGGMGAVYQAWDQELGVPVALKVIRMETDDPLMAEEMSARFKRELLLAREVTHKNVVRIHDMGDFGGMKYFTMSFVKGQDLSSILEERSRLPISRALEIFRQVVDGMIAAHEKGIVHRDMKPANIMIDEEGNALLMDFGIARSAGMGGDQKVAAAQIDPTTLETRETINLGKTMVGSIVGTLEYMAPEQFRGKVADQRADVYALGLILYDMILGRRRVRSAKSALNEVKQRVKEAPLSPRTVDETIPEGLDELIEKCLAPDPEDRFQSTTELREALDLLDDEGRYLPKYSTRTKVLAGLGATAVIAALLTTWFLARGRVIVEPEPMTVLVADFLNETGDRTLDGAVEEALGIALEGAGFISAYPRGTALNTADKLQEGSSLDQTMARLISRSQGIDAIVVGAIEPAGNGYRITAEAVDPALEPGQGRALARARARAGDQNDVLAAVNEIGVDLRRELGDTTTESGEQAATETVTAASLEAMQAYSEGQDLSYRGQFQNAVTAFERAIDEDPEFGRAFAAMGTQYINLGKLDLAEENFQKALQHLDRMTERERLRTMGSYYVGVSRNYEKAVENLEKLVAAYPADRTGHMNLALASYYLRDFGRAVEEQALAVELDPNSLIQRINYAFYALTAGRFDLAIEQSNWIIEQTAGEDGGLSNILRGDARFTIGRAQAAAGDIEGARTIFEELRATAGRSASQGVIGGADLAMFQGRPEDALAIVDPWVEAYDSEGRLGEAADKLVVEAEALLLQGDADRAATIASLATSQSNLESILYPAARVLIAAGQTDRALAIADRLENMLQTQTTSYAKLLRGEAALRAGRLPEATRELREGGELYDSWFAHFLLGQAYVEAKLGPDALNEFVWTVEGKGEAVDVFLSDSSTLRYWPPALYWLGRAHELLGSSGPAREAYEQFLAIRGDGVEDELVRDARVRLEAARETAA